MDIVDSILIPSWKEKHQRRKRAAAVLGSIIVAAGVAEWKYGAISGAYRRIKRACMVAMATLLEDSAGMPMITVLGEDDEAHGALSQVDLKQLRNRGSLQRGRNDAVVEDHAICSSMLTGESEGGSSANLSQHGQQQFFQQQQQQQDDPTPQFFQSTKFFAVLEQEEATELFNKTLRRHLRPGEILFQHGDASDDGIFIVIKGLLGVYLENSEPGSDSSEFHANTLKYGESVGDLDVVDGAPRTVTCRAMSEGCSLVQVPRDLFVSFCMSHPRALLLYLQQGLARLWRVANFMLADFLKLPPQSCQQAMSPSCGHRHSTLATASSLSTAPSSSLLPARSLSLRNHNWSGSGTAQMSSSPLPPSPGFKEWVNIGNPSLLQPSAGVSADLPWGMGTPSKGAIEAAAKVAQGHLPASFMGPGLTSSSPAGRNPASFIGSGMSSSPPGRIGLPMQGKPLPASSTYFEATDESAYPVACLANGWDIASRQEVAMDKETWSLLTDALNGVSIPFPLAKGGLLQDENWACSQLYLLVDGELLAERRKASNNDKWEKAVITKGSFISCAAFLSSTSCRCRVTASINNNNNHGQSSPLSPVTGLANARLVSFGWQQLDSLADSCPQLLVSLLTSASVTMGPLIRRFISLGMNRVWLKSGDVAYRQDQEAESLFVIISGRIRLLHEYQHNVSGKIQLKTEEEVGRGEAIGAVWAITGGQHDSTSLCVRDSELVRMSKNSLQRISQVFPMALSSLFSNIAKRLTAARDSRMAKDAKTGAGGVRHHHPPLSHSLHSTRPSSPVASRALTASFSKDSMASSHLSGLQSKPGTGGGGGQRGEIVTIAVLPSGLVTQQSGGMQWGAPQGRMNAPGAAGLLAVKRLASALKESLGQYGPCLQLNSTSIGLLFPAAFERLDVLFYRSKITSWLSSQEEEYRFIILEGDNFSTPWSSVCVAQADAILLVAAEGAQPVLGPVEGALVFSTSSVSVNGLGAGAEMTFRGSSQAAEALNLQTGFGTAQNPENPEAEGTYYQLINPASTPSATPAKDGQDPLSLGLDVSPILASHQSHPFSPFTPSTPLCSNQPNPLLAGKSVSAAQLRRTELVLLHSEASGDPLPHGTLEWLKQRPHLARHHHIRLGRHADIERLGRWMSGKASGLVLSGGGSRGLAHLGVLCALEDCGIAIDCIGGTSQGAFMAALYAQGLSRDQLQAKVHEYASKMGSMRAMLRDLTLPLLSVFSGRGFDEAMRQCFSAGADQIEDLWLPFFCVTTNLTKGEPSIHHKGTLWKLVRASMTIVGLLPPVYEEGEGLLVDGGYMNNLPVDVMRSMGVDQVIVVDVEGKDESGWSALSSTLDGGVSGWKIFWDRTLGWLIPSLRSGTGDMPKYSQIINQLTWMTHAHNLKRVARDYKIDLYLRPPVQVFRLLDYHLYGRIVKQAYRYAAGAIVDWQRSEEPLQQDESALALPREATPPVGSVQEGPSYQHFSWANASTTASATSEHQSHLPPLPPFHPPQVTETTTDDGSSTMNDLLESILSEENMSPSFQPRMARVRTTKKLQRLEEDEEEGDADKMSMSSLAEENEEEGPLLDGQIK